MSTKLFCNEQTDIISDALEGIHDVYQGLFVSADDRLVMINRERENRVAILAGCGAGHEPYPTGHVGENMLTGCVIGPLFSAPSVSQIINAIFNLRKWNKGGIVLIGSNYTTDSLNFWLAARRAMEEDIKIAVIIMADDCVFEEINSNSNHINMTRKRGLCGAIVCAKILGGMSAKGFSLEQINYNGNMINVRTTTISTCYNTCQYFQDYHQLRKSKKKDILIGQDAYCEEGCRRVKPLKQIVEQMIEQIFEVSLIAPGDKVLLLVNDCGTCTEMELFILARELGIQLASKVLVIKTFVGRFFTSFDMKSFQICLTNITANEHWLQYIDLKTEAYAWPGNRLDQFQPDRPDWDIFTLNIDKLLKPHRWKLNYAQAHVFGECIKATCNKLKKIERELNIMDAVHRTGDFGTKVKLLADRILKDVKGASLLMDLSKTFLVMARITEEEVESIFGPVLSMLFTGAAKGNCRWESVWQEALDTLAMYSTARIGHRTLLDALIPAYRAFKGILNEKGAHFWKKALKHALVSAEIGCQETIRMRPKTWIELQGEPALRTPDSVPDPGAYIVVIWLKTIDAETSKERRHLQGMGKTRKI